MDTIYALATLRGRSGIATIRISGFGCRDIAEAMLGRVPSARHASFTAIRRKDGSVLDQGLALFFEAPASFTGEDVLELQTHGSVAVIDAILSELSTFQECRLAEPGEFTRRALSNGKMDLTQVEGLSDVIDAETERQREQALLVTSGAFTEMVESLRADIIRAAALLEATIDFADEDVPEDVTDEVLDLLQRSSSVMSTEAEAQVFSERLRTGFEVAIVGRPNVGKSTLLNALAGREAAITSEYAGTTRDIIEVRMDLNGIPVTLLDTAGIRDAADPVERVGVERAQSRAAAADIRVYLYEHDEDLPEGSQSGDIILRAKSDTGTKSGVGISGKTGFGVDALIDQLTSKLESKVARAGLASRQRHKQAFLESVELLKSAEASILTGEDFFDVAAEDIRTALRRLDSIIGRTDVENLLDVIFSSFCLGK